MAGGCEDVSSNTACSAGIKTSFKDYLYFIHIPKTAGTYVTSSLVATLGAQFVREGHSVPACALRPWTERFGPVHFTSVPRSRCTVFTVVRNPFDLLVSMYTFGFPYWAPRYANQGQSIMWPFKSFRDFVSKLCQWDDYPWIMPSQQKSLFFQLYDDDGCFLPDYVLRQEDMAAGLSGLGDALGIDVHVPAHRINVSRTEHYREFYDDTLISLVQKHFAGDLQAFGYTFDGHDGRVIFRPEAVNFDHAAGVYRGLTCNPPIRRGPPLNGRLADIDLHPLSSEVLSRYRGAALVREFYFRLRRRLGLRFSQNRAD